MFSLERLQCLSLNLDVSSIATVGKNALATSFADVRMIRYLPSATALLNSLVPPIERVSCRPDLPKRFAIGTPLWLWYRRRRSSLAGVPTPFFFDSDV